MTRKSRQKPKRVQESDQNFDALSQKFTSQITGTLKGEIRLAVLQRELQKMVGSKSFDGLKVLDLGAGQGQMALHLARSGARLCLVDLSQEMLDHARAAFAQEGLLDRVEFHCMSMREFLQNSNQSFDLVLCHAVMEWLQNAKEDLDFLLGHLASHAKLSLMFYNHYGLEMHHLLLGNFDHIQSGMRNKKSNTVIPLRAYKPEEVETWIQMAGFEVHRKVGVRVLHDFLRDKENALVQKNTSLIEMELARSEHPVFWQLGRYVHFDVRPK